MHDVRLGQDSPEVSQSLSQRANDARPSLSRRVNHYCVPSAMPFYRSGRCVRCGSRGNNEEVRATRVLDQASIGIKLIEHDDISMACLCLDELASTPPRGLNKCVDER